MREKILLFSGFGLRALAPFSVRYVGWPLLASRLVVVDERYEIDPSTLRENAA